MTHEEIKDKLKTLRDSFDENINAWGLIQHTIDYIDMLVGATEILQRALDTAREHITKDTAKEILDEVAKHYGGAWLVELYKKYGVEVSDND